MKRETPLLAFSTLLLCLVAQAAHDRPSVQNLGGTGYHVNNWFAFGATVSSDKDLLLESGEDFVLSPRYAAPIRKVVLSVKGSSSEVALRKLWLRPFVGGIETSTDAFACSVERVSAEFEAFCFDFRQSDRVDALRICLDATGKTTWRVREILVFYGDKEKGEDDLLRDIAQQLPAPENLRATSLTADSLVLAADAVAGQDVAGYRFAVDRLDGLPRTECREDFAAAPVVSAGWTFGETNGVALGQYVGSGYYDGKTSSDKVALKIEVKGAKGSRVEILSPLVEERISEWSFASRASGTGRSGTVTVYGRSSETDEWRVLSDPIALTTSLVVTTNAVSADVDIRQVKFVFVADAGSTANAALDSLRIVYGGHEMRTPIWKSEEPSQVPTCEPGNLIPNARYAFRVQAVANPPCRDSSWTDDQVVDLSWASISVQPPTDVTWTASGGKMTVRWTAVQDADHYLVTVVSMDDLEHPVVRDAKAAGTSYDVTVPAVGEYAVRVAAVSPGGLSVATSTATEGTVTLGALDAVTLKVIDRQTIEASWKKVPLAEGYQARLVRVDGTRANVKSVRVAGTTVTFRDLDPNGKYAVTVVPQPSEDGALGAKSPVVDLAGEKLRKTGAVPLSELKGKCYFEDFSSLTNVTADVETGFVDLDYWQFGKGSGEPEKLLYASDSSRTTGGVYVFCDQNRTEASFMLGTLATSAYGCSVGIAFRNDTDAAFEVKNLSFDTIQRTFGSARKSYALEWLLTDGVAGIDTEGAWQSLAMPETAPHVAGASATTGEYRLAIPSVDGLPRRIPVGGVLILRWRHERGASSPAMGLDNVRLEVQRAGKGFRFITR